MHFPDNMNEQILGNISTAIVVLDDHLQILFCNSAAEALLEVSNAQMKGQCVVELIRNGKDLTTTLRSAIDENQTYTQRQARLTIPGGDEITADLTMTPVIDDGQPLLLLELIPLDRYLRIDRDAALKEHHEVSRMMIRGLAHEIKNPLGGIKGSAQLLARELADKSLNEYTNIIIDEADRLTTLVDRMLGPNSLPELKQTNIHEILERGATLIELEADPSLTIERDYDPSIPEISVDPERILQAILNLLRNAMQCLMGAVPNPIIKITTRIERQFTISGKRHKVILRIDITDNGPGIPEDIREHLFYPMITRRPGGTGLGLTLSQEIINLHGGLVEFTTEPGKTVFSMYIPIAQSEPISHE